MTDSNPEIRPFDRVRLKSGGPLMMVTSFLGEEPVRCVFKSDEGEVRYEFYPAADLEKGDRNAVVFPPSEEELRRKETFANLKERYPDLIPAKVSFECGKGWAGILTRYFDDVREILPHGVGLRLERVYEKHGDLNIDAGPTGPVSPEVSIALSKAEKLAWFRSLLSCETCGNPGRMRDSSRLFVACEEHSEGDAPLPRSDDGSIGECGVGDDFRYGYDEEADDLVLIGRWEGLPEEDEQDNPL